MDAYDLSEYISVIMTSILITLLPSVMIPMDPIVSNFSDPLT